MILFYHFIFCLSSPFLKFFQFFFDLIFSGENVFNPPLFLFTLHYYNIIFSFICQYFFLIFLKFFLVKIGKFFRLLKFSFLRYISIIYILYKGVFLKKLHYYKQITSCYKKITVNSHFIQIFLFIFYS